MASDFVAVTTGQAAEKMIWLVRNCGSKQGETDNLGDDLGVTADMDRVVGCELAITFALNK